jgi:hypothetical protein
MENGDQRSFRSYPVEGGNGRDTADFIVREESGIFSIQGDISQIDVKGQKQRIEKLDSVVSELAGQMKQWIENGMASNRTGASYMKEKGERNASKSTGRRSVSPKGKMKK